ncbi:uncharacterized protein LOC111710413 [Eurytemora carolleeae]|uniref:uncharacterized protein LOC111710413 n=1 Tax=Eurytemora carolleeae TaxID=1294199 RepID=UPI000C75FBA7|nr:uncharacterized protein LOC111710413 [Eurytemora carolleeae]|eukprot:XP_023340262.1 uncharacterized protein LOC111710413 [Eurytemora affinis]
MKILILLSLCVAYCYGQSCNDFQVGTCPLTEYTIVAVNHHIASPSLCQDECRLEPTGTCSFFTHFETQCYQLKSCDFISTCPGCVSGPVSPDFDTCEWPSNNCK